MNGAFAVIAALNAIAGIGIVRNTCFGIGGIEMVSVIANTNGTAVIFDCTNTMIAALDIFAGAFFGGILIALGQIACI